MSSARASAVQLYVYYRVAGDRHAARRTIAALLAEVEARAGVAGRLLMRCDDPCTWMEIYAPVVDVAAFRAILDEAVRVHRPEQHADGGQRHLECFTAVRVADDAADAT